MTRARLSNFYPRSPCGERPRTASDLHSAVGFLSTLSLRRATLQADGYRIHAAISIHALLAESDMSQCLPSRRWCYFYPRSPCGERPAACWVGQKAGYFYPRSPCGERHLRLFVIYLICHFYPRSPCGERLVAASAHVPAGVFLSTLSLRRATWAQLGRFMTDGLFLSTLSLRRATF